MVQIATGWWKDQSQPSSLQDTITLSVENAGYLITALAVLVTIAGASVWGITAFALHSVMVRKTTPDALDRQVQVILWNNPGAIGTIWAMYKIWRSWFRDTRKPTWRTFIIVLPAAVILAGGYIASIFSSTVANRAYGVAVARLRPQNCGFWQINANGSTTSGPLAVVAAYTAKVTSDTFQARTYMINNYYGTTPTASGARPIFKQSTLAFRTNLTAPCPIPNQDRCRLGRNGALSMTTEMLNSQTAFGINSPTWNQINFEASVTCSPISTTGLEGRSQFNNKTVLWYDLGRSVYGPFTYIYNPAVAAAGYVLKSLSAADGGWLPSADFRRSDADISAFFLGAGGIAYSGAVFDPWFSANGSHRTDLGGSQPSFDADREVSVMVCADQYKFCNPSNGRCVGPLGKYQFDNALESNEPGFNPAQIATILRINIALVASSTFYSVVGLGPAALFANNVLFDVISPSLPDDQWRKEVLGWFQTSLTKLQLYLVDFASNTDDLGPLGSILSPWTSALNESDEIVASWRDQCENQLVQIAGEVQNFNAFGVLFIICFSTVVTILYILLESITDFINRRLARESLSGLFRKTDGLLHLLRMVLPLPLVNGTHWVLGKWESVPVLRGGNGPFERPQLDNDGLPSYRQRPQELIEIQTDNEDHVVANAEHQSGPPGPLDLVDSQVESVTQRVSHSSERPGTDRQSHPVSADPQEVAKNQAATVQHSVVDDARRSQEDDLTQQTPIISSQDAHQPSSSQSSTAAANRSE